MKTIVDAVTVHGRTEDGKAVEAWAHVPHTAEILGLHSTGVSFRLVVKFTREDGIEPTSRRLRVVLLDNCDELPEPAHKMRYIGTVGDLHSFGLAHVFIDQ